MFYIRIRTNYGLHYYALPIIIKNNGVYLTILYNEHNNYTQHIQVQNVYARVVCNNTIIIHYIH